MDSRSFYWTRRPTKLTFIAEEYDAIENNKNVVNITALPPIDGDLGSKKNDGENVISNTEEMMMMMMMMMMMTFYSRLVTIFKYMQCTLSKA